jgi:uncharacterized membrane protein YebE (DUF533 family)
MKLLKRLENIYREIMGIQNLNKTSVVKEVVTALIGKDETEADYHEEVYLLLKAMINAAKSDGTIDAKEQQKIMEFMGDMSKVEQMFVKYEMTQSLNLDAFLKEIPQGMEQQVYYMSLFAIDLDVEAERVYLDKLAEGLKLSIEDINIIHESLDAEIIA